MERRHAWSDADRQVDLSEDGGDATAPALPDQTTDDTDRGWGEPGGSNDEWLLRERPPHWA